MTDIEIARSCRMEPICEIARRAGIPQEHLEQYGRYKAKVGLSFLESGEQRRGKLVLVTAVTPTPAGEGKTTTTVALADGLRRIGLKSAAALREPSLGPVFGVKGGAAGGGYAQVVPMEDINLHFTGDFHAVSAANNLLAAMIDNHIFQGNELGIDPQSVTWRRCLDMNDRQLRRVVDGLGAKAGGVPREDGFDITAASEVMAVLCLSSSLEDLKARLSRIVVGTDRDGRYVTAGDLKAQGAMAALLRDAIRPNLVQTLEGTPAFVHGGPVANIAHGCNSVLATRMAMACSDYCVTEAGFGADLGAEKFMDIKCRMAGLEPDCAVLVATVRALKLHGGAKKAELSKEDLAALEKGMANLYRHAGVLSGVFGLPVVCAVNRFPTDTDEELGLLVRLCREKGIRCEVCEGWAKGGEGAEALARAVAEACGREKRFAYCYEDGLALRDKILAVVRRVYGGSDIRLSPAASKALRAIEQRGYGSLPVCMAKTQYSFTDDPKKLNAPEGFTVHVADARLSAGAGFVVALTGEIMTMPGLPKEPAAERIDVDGDGVISGLF